MQYFLKITTTTNIVGATIWLVSPLLPHWTQREADNRGELQLISLLDIFNHREMKLCNIKFRQIRNFFPQNFVNLRKVAISYFAKLLSGAISPFSGILHNESYVFCTY
jgi:hypothetical protein